MRQAAETLEKKGDTEPAAKLRAQIERLEATLKQSAKPQAPPEVRDALKPAPDVPPAVRRPALPGTDSNAAVLAEIRKLNKQLGDMNARIRKLEAATKHN